MLKIHQTMPAGQSRYRQCLRPPTSTLEGTGRIRRCADAMLPVTCAGDGRGVHRFRGGRNMRACAGERVWARSGGPSPAVPFPRCGKREQRPAPGRPAAAAGVLIHLFCPLLVHRQAHCMRHPALFPWRLLAPRFAAARRATAYAADRCAHARNARCGVTMISRCRIHQEEKCITRSGSRTRAWGDYRLR